MEKIILVYRTDVHHSHESKELIGIATSKRNASTICRAASWAEGDRLSKEQQDLLERIGQTQGYEGQGEFYTETWPLDKLL
jgi:hypothetical protein